MASFAPRPNPGIPQQIPGGVPRPPAGIRPPTSNPIRSNNPYRSPQQGLTPELLAQMAQRRLGG